LTFSLFLGQVLDDIMVLRVENGQDFFITVKGNYARSCFGKRALVLEDLTSFT
jgi:hypothetical protein